MSETITGRIEAKTAPTEKGLVTVTIGGKKYKTMKPEVYGGLILGQQVEAVVNETPGTGTNPRTGQLYGPTWWLEAWKPVAGDIPIVMGPGADPMSKEEWAAKDRAVWMESAYKSAATFATALHAELPTGEQLYFGWFRAIAWDIYEDIGRAWRGEARPELEPTRGGETVSRQPHKLETAGSTPAPATSALDAAFGPHPADTWSAKLDGAAAFPEVNQALAEMPRDLRNHPAIVAAIDRAKDRIKP